MITFNEWLEKIDEVVTTRPKVPHTKDFAGGEIRGIFQAYKANKLGETLTPEKLKELRNELQSWSDVARDLPVYKELEAKLMAAKPTSVAPQKGMQLSDLSGKEASDFRTVGKKAAPPKAAPRKSFLSFLTGR
jgi:hypothetical protein